MIVRNKISTPRERRLKKGTFLFAVICVVLGYRLSEVGPNLEYQLDTGSSQSTRLGSAAQRHTFGLLDKISDEEWEAIRQKTIRTSWYENPKNPLENVDEPLLWNEKNMIPNFDCPIKEAVPKRVKGETKYVCNPQRLVYDGKEGGCLIYSFGCAGDFSFEDEISKMHNKACEIHVFDPAKAWERKDDIPSKNIHYHAWGLRSTYDDSKSVVWPKGRGGGFKTFPETLELLGHTNRIIDILKVSWLAILKKRILANFWLPRKSSKILVMTMII